MTPYELNLVVESYKEKQRKIEENMIIQAYLISRWVWSDKVDINKYISNKPKKTMSDEEILARVKMLNNLFGGEVKTCNF